MYEKGNINVYCLLNAIQSKWTVGLPDKERNIYRTSRLIPFATAARSSGKDGIDIILVHIIVLLFVVLPFQVF